MTWVVACASRSVDIVEEYGKDGEFEEYGEQRGFDEPYSHSF
jgi:hypothetical protein